jgi:crotonobetainyl-CoA:carnitine CoA-transferase CaiB-like acyl-CoA transferase
MTINGAPGALARFRILDLTGPLGQPTGRHLADLGAYVILVEPPGGSPSRRMAPYAARGGGAEAERSIYFLHANTNKRGIVLDIESPEGREAFFRLVRGADAVLEGFPPGYLDSLGLGYEALERERPGLVLTSITPFGQTGVHRDFQGNDFICDALGGLTHMEGERDGRPVAQPHYQAIQMTALHAAYGTLLALWHSARTGQGQQVDVSVQDVVAHEYFNLVNYGSYQEVLQRTGGLSQGRPTNYFPCSDGWVLISIVLPHQWRAFADWTQDPILMDPMFDDHALRAESVEFLDERVSAFTQTMTVQEFLEGAIPRRIPAGPVNDVRGFVEHPQTRARNWMAEVDHPVVGRYQAPGPSARYAETPWRIRRPAPILGQHTQEVMREAGGRAVRGVDRRQASPPSSLPLEGIRVLDLTKSWAGPYGTRYLGDFGAEVIRIESLKFPEGRQLTKEPDPANWLRSNTMFAEINRNKVSVTLDLHTEEGRDILKRLVAQSDVLVENFHYAALPKWGLGYEELRKVNPRLVMLSSPGFGSTGPIRDYFAYGGCIVGFTGIGYLWGHPEATQNEKAKQAYTDFVTAGNLALAVMVALHHREVSGMGQHIELAQSEAGAAMIATAILEYTLNGTDPQPRGNRDPNAAPQGVYRCKGDDRWVAVSCATDDQWQALCRLSGAQELLNDPRYATLEGRHAAHDELDARISAWAAQLTPHQAMYRCQAAGVPAGVVATGEDLFLDPHLRTRGYVVEIDHPAPGRLAHPGMTVRLTRTPGQVRLPAPLTGQHTEEVMARLLGLPAEEQQALVERGVLV